jgi:hypothetical protein
VESYARYALKTRGSLSVMAAERRCAKSAAHSISGASVAATAIQRRSAKAAMLIRLSISGKVLSKFRLV